MLDILAKIPATAYAALVGAILSAVIAFIGVYFTNRGHTERLLLQLNNERDRKKEELVREKLEELYLLLDSWLTALSSHYLPYFQVMKGEISYNDALDIFIESAKERAYDFKRLDMLIHLYFPSLNATYEKVLRARDEANNILTAHKWEYKRGHTEARQFIEPLTAALDRLEKSGELMKSEIIDLSQKHLSPLSPSRVKVGLPKNQ